MGKNLFSTVIHFDDFYLPISGVCFLPATQTLPSAAPELLDFSKQRDLTLKLLMSYIYIYMEHLFLMFLDHTQRRSTVGRTPLDE